MLSIASVKTETHARQVFVCVLLQNQGPYVVKPGTVFGRQTSREGAVHQVEFSNSLNITPGGTARVGHLVAAMSELEFTGYRQSDGEIIPFSGGVVRRLSLFRSVELVMMRWRDEVFLPWTTSIAAHFKELRGNAWIRVSEAYKTVKHEAQVVRSALGSNNAAIVRWQEEVLLPKLKSVAARTKETLYRLK